MQPILSTENANVLQRALAMGHFKATGFQLCTILENSTFNGNVYIFKLGGAVVEKNPSMEEFVSLIDSAAVYIFDMIGKEYPYLHRIVSNDASDKSF
jgi:hypothetical protein